MALSWSKTKLINQKHIIKLNQAARLLSAEYRIPKVEDEYTDKPKYPPIVDQSPKAVERVKEESWYESIRKLSTVEEKLFAINMPRYWGWNCVMLKEGQIPYNSLNFTQYVTRTHLLSSTDLPEEYKTNKELSQKLAVELKSAITDELEFQLAARDLSKTGRSELSKEKDEANIIIKALNRILLREVSNNVPHLAECEVDYSPRIEAFWSIGGINPPDTVVARRKKEKKLNEENYKDPIDRWVQYIGSPALQIRHEKPLPPIWSSDVKGEVPTWKLDPEVLGFKNDYRHGTSIPGFWPGDFRDFGVLSYHHSNHVRHRPPSYGAEDSREALQAQAILASFGWLVPLAAYHGFSPFCEITYPMSTQAVLTDGKDFTFSLYQMNTNKLYSEFATESDKVNLCWCSPTQPLYAAFEDGRIKDLNEDVLSMLVLFYLAQPKEMRDVNLRPYLGKEVQRVADIPEGEDEKRCWLEKEFKHLFANRPRHRTDFQYELYEWERIYKVEHKTRPMDPRRRPFELEEHPYRRQLSDHPGEYIPRGLRPDKDLPKGKQKKFKKTYYPL